MPFKKPHICSIKSVTYCESRLVIFLKEAFLKGLFKKAICLIYFVPLYLFFLLIILFLMVTPHWRLMKLMLPFCPKTLPEIRPKKQISKAKIKANTPLFLKAIVLWAILYPAGLFYFTSYYTGLLPQ